ncbi:Glycerophosphocholine phosphodiesterase gpcpd1, partial [Cichlidogyrus casuarinus]
TFPLLRDCLEQVDPDLGFNIEIKWPMILRNGEAEMDNFFEPNYYVDRILGEIFRHANKRKIIISCFSPDICAMVNLKQNLYPVLLLGGDSDYADFRVSSIERTVSVACAEQLLGVALDAGEVLLASPDFVEHIRKKLNLVVFVWGEKGNHLEHRKELYKRGVNGVIYDR